MNIKVEQVRANLYTLLLLYLRTYKNNATVEIYLKGYKQENKTLQTRANKPTQTLQASSTAADIRQGIWGYHIFTVEILW